MKSGGAKGIDEIAELTAKPQQITTKIFRPDIQQWNGKIIYCGGGCPTGYLKGFKDRNKEIAEYCDRLYCLRSRQSTTYGSGWTADEAERLGKVVRRVYL